LPPAVEIYWCGFVKFMSLPRFSVPPLSGFVSSRNPPRAQPQKGKSSFNREIREIRERGETKLVRTKTWTRIDANLKDDVAAYQVRATANPGWSIRSLSPSRPWALPLGSFALPVSKVSQNRPTLALSFPFSRILRISRLRKLLSWDFFWRWFVGMVVHKSALQLVTHGSAQERVIRQRQSRNQLKENILTAKYAKYAKKAPNLKSGSPKPSKP